MVVLALSPTTIDRVRNCRLSWHQHPSQWLCHLQLAWIGLDLSVTLIDLAVDFWLGMALVAWSQWSHGVGSFTRTASLILLMALGSCAFAAAAVAAGVFQ